MADLQAVDSIYVGAASTEALYPRNVELIELLTSNGISVETQFYPGGHNWAIWRQLLRDFLLDTAFSG